MTNPKISVVVPVYNTEKYLKRSLDSILNQSLKDIEVICVNDGSTDSSLNILKNYAKKDSRIILINQQNKGLGAARNIGIRASNSENIIFFDSDDTVDESMLEKLYSTMNSENSDIVYTRYKYLLNDGSVEKDSPRINIFTKNEIFGALVSYDLPPSASLYLLKKELFLMSGIYYPERLYYEDLATAYKLFFYAKKISIVNEVLYNYYRYIPQSISNRFTIKHIKDFFYIIDDTKLFLDKRGILLTYERNLLERFYQTLCYILTKAFKNSMVDNDVLLYLWEEIETNYFYYFREMDFAKQIQLIYLTLKCSDNYNLEIKIRKFFLEKTLVNEKLLEDINTCINHELGLLYGIIRFFENNPSKKVIYVYGAGEAYQKLKPYFIRKNLQINGIVDKNINLPDNPMNIESLIKDINSQELNEVFIVLATEVFFEEIKDSINKYKKDIKAKINYVTIKGLE